MRWAALVLALCTAACAELLDIDRDYVVVSTAAGAGGGGSGGVGIADGGRLPLVTGGAGGVFARPDASQVEAGTGMAGMTVEASVDVVVEAPDACPSDMKRCDGLCVTADPSVGCGREGCAQCDFPPENAIAVCDEARQCAFECRAGFVTNATNTGCDATPSSGGAGGMDSGAPTGGSGGLPTCDPNACPPCPFIDECCNVFGRCGCRYVLSCL